MKRICVIACTLLLLSLCACSKKGDTKIETCIIPNSYLKFTKTSAEDMVQSIIKLGEEYSTSAVTCEEGVKLELTQTQKENLLKRNDEYADKFISEFLEYDSLYQCEKDENYEKWVVYCDEKIPIMLEMNSIFGVATGYGLNYILANNTTDWNVEVTVYNCHTRKVVVSGSIPNDKISFGAEEWKKSYEE